MEILNDPASFYVYRHIRSDKNEVFYIGIGRHQKKWKHARLRCLKNRNKHWWNIVNLNNGEFKSQLIMDGLTQKEACQKEIELIKFYGRSDLGLGTLCNLTDGGEGAFNLKHSEESKRKMSEQRKGIKPSRLCVENRILKLTGSGNPNYGKPLPEWQKEINRKAQLGRKHSKETIEKRVQKLRGKKRSKEFCDLIRQHSIAQSDMRRNRAIKQWTVRKTSGFKNLTDKEGTLSKF